MTLGKDWPEWIDVEWRRLDLSMALRYEFRAIWDLCRIPWAYRA